MKPRNTSKSEKYKVYPFFFLVSVKIMNEQIQAWYFRLKQKEERNFHTQLSFWRRSGFDRREESWDCGLGEREKREKSEKEEVRERERERERVCVEIAIERD